MAEVLDKRRFIKAFGCVCDCDIMVDADDQINDQHEGGSEEELFGALQPAEKLLENEMFACLEQTKLHDPFEGLRIGDSESIVESEKSSQGLVISLHPLQAFAKTDPTESAFDDLD